MIDVAMTRDDLRPADIAVVIDVLRATSTAVQALAAGYRRIVFADTIERAQALRAPGRILAGERHCVMPDGFDQGNSPQEARDRRGEELVLATTNGAPTVVAAAEHAELVLIGCLLNLDAVRGAVLDRMASGDRHVQLVCSGTDGMIALEDVYGAGRLSALLPGPRSDAARVAEAVAAAYPSAGPALAESRDAAALRRVGCESDIAFCAQESILRLTGSVALAGAGVAEIIVSDDRPAESELPVERRARVPAAAAESA